MPNVLELKQRATELKTEAITALKDCETGTITVAQLTEKMDKIETEDKAVADGIKAYNRAISYRQSMADRTHEGGEPVEPGMEDAVPFGVHAKQNLELQAQMVSRAKAHGRGEFVFESLTATQLGGMKQAAQGVGGMQGEQTSGTTAPAVGPLGAGEYFYSGPAGPTIQPTFIPGIVELRWYPNVIASLFPSFAVATPIVTYVRETAWDNEAAAVKEGAQKPTSGNTVVRYNANVGKIANLMRVTEEVVQDAPYFWSLVQRRGVQGVSRKEEVELLAGPGLPGIFGLLNYTAPSSGTSYPGNGFHQPQTVAARNVTIGAATGAGAGSETISVTPGRSVTTNGSGTDGTTIAEAALDAIYDIRVNYFFEPDALVFNPTNWKTVRLAKDSNGQYLGGSFFGANYSAQQDAGQVGIFENLSLWNKRVVSTPAMPEHHFLAGDFGDSSQILRLGGVRTDVTNLNGYDFENNLWTMRVEERVGLLVERPELFELVAITGAGS